MTKSEVLPVYIGYDSREPEAYEVARYSILKHATMPVHIQKGLTPSRTYVKSLIDGYNAAGIPLEQIRDSLI